MDRRTFMKAAAIAASTPATIGSISVAISDMYREWLAVRYRPSAGKTEAEMDEGFYRYQTLQRSIIEAEPQTPRDVAIQFIVDTDDGDNYHSDDFERRIRQLAAS